MNSVFMPELDKFVVIFINDILIYSKTKEDHANHISIVLQRLRGHRLYAKFSKCEFWLYSVKFLGHTISSKGISVDPTKVQEFMDWKPGAKCNIYTDHKSLKYIFTQANLNMRQRR
jgi:hypothetical protein